MGKWKLKELFWVPAQPATPARPELMSATGPFAASSARTAQMDQVLGVLRDVEGVVGSIAIETAGALLASDLPRIFDAPATEAVAMRLNQLRAALASGGVPLKAASLRYETHELHVTPLECGLLGVLAEARTSEPALAMATKLVGKRLDAAVNAARA